MGRGVNRGEIWSVAGGGYATKPRPALIVQDDRYPVSSVTVLLMTSTLVDAPLYRIRVESGELSGLRVDSDVMIDKITTVKRTQVSNRIGRVSSAQMLEVERMLMAFLGLAG